MTYQNSYSTGSKGAVTLILLVIVALVVLYFGLRYKENIGNFVDGVKGVFTKTKTVVETGKPQYTKAIDTLKSFLNTLPEGKEGEIKKFLTEKAQEDKTWFEPWSILDLDIGKVNPMGSQNVEIETTITSKSEKGSPIHLDLNFELVQENGEWKVAGKAERK